MARALAKMSFEDVDMTDDVADLSMSEREILDNFIGKFQVKYRIMGHVVKEKKLPVSKKSDK